MKTFLLGCGAQKAGTTWLARNLSQSPEYWNGGIKEWRFWKHYFNPKSRMSQLRKMKSRLGDASPHSRDNEWKLRWRISALQDPESFLQRITDEFRSNDDVKVLGDLTPVNGTLPREQLTFIDQYFKQREIITKPVFLMRDPFERIWSEVRMRICNRFPESYREDQAFVFQKLLERYRLPAVERKTRYEHIIENLENVFGVDNIYYGFSERLFTQAGLEQITNHLGIPTPNADCRSPNPSPNLGDVPYRIKQEVIDFYKDTYRAVVEKFGEDVKLLWQESFRLLKP